MKHVVLFSGGVGSWAAAKRVAERYGTDDLILLFTDTNMEDEDLYRFLDEAADNIGGELVKISDGRTPWDVFFDERFLGNTRADPCSKILKRNLSRQYILDHFHPDDTILYIGIDWTEAHRFERFAKHWEPWKVEAPMCDDPLMGKDDMLAALEAEGIQPPRLYEMGFPHNNCGGFCVKAGQAHFKLLLETMPDRYLEHERREEELRQYLDKDVSILRDRRGGTTTPMTLRQFRERLEEDGQCDMFEWGGCGCFSDV